MRETPPHRVCGHTELFSWALGILVVWPGVATCHCSDTGGDGIGGTQVEEELSGACLEEDSRENSNHCEIASEILRRLATWES
ncbi:hypothetical protein F5148DRAFT_1234565 [Russula earlei]|uniref:Uncharacterized protein n=1 Tax=Russula earlei TaxID=71964 RepID=A0ACC0TZF5_9AGAM|nr:hypothetical protein F5148DRAFT_1234565 [Russula earlei]